MHCLVVRVRLAVPSWFGPAVKMKRVRQAVPLLHARRGSRGPLWQHQYWDRFVRDEREFNERLEYLHLNPVKKGLVKRREDWRRSSYNHFALDKATVGVSHPD